MFLGQGYVFTGVCDSVNRGGVPHPPPEQTPPSEQIPPEQTPREQTPTSEHAVRYGQCAGGTHPTGIQSCYIFMSYPSPGFYWNPYFLPSATKLRRLCFYTCLSVILFTGGVLSQHALQVVSQHALQQRGAIPACIAGGIPTYIAVGGVIPACIAGGIPACLAARGGSAPGGCLLQGGVETPPESRRLLLRTVRILLECILVKHFSCTMPATSIINSNGSSHTSQNPDSFNPQIKFISRNQMTL